MRIPEIRKDERGISTLYIDDRPFFIYGGELHNSDTSDPAYMERAVWPALEGLHMNTVVAPVYWELIEDQQGTYDFSHVDSLVLQAREHDLHLVLLWFGLWKNAESMYVPAWMKKDTDRYFRVQTVAGDRLNTISPLCQEAIDRDAACFKELMAHLKDLDSEHGTVLMLQVENEIGVLGSARDYGDQANERFEGTIPDQLAAATGKQGTWQEAYGADAEEAFMAWHFARAVEQITSAGSREYPLPMYANSWLKQYPWYPGSYPSGGPVPQMQAIWRVAAPSISFFAPDIYVPYCAEVLDEYGTADNPLFVPEIRKDAVTASYCLYAFGAKNAIGYSPFGIEEITMDPALVDRPPMEVMIALNIDPSAFDIAGSADLLSVTYAKLHEMEPLLLENRGTDRMQCFVRHGENDYGTLLHFRELDIRVAYDPRQSGKPLAAGLFLERDGNDFLLTGMMCRVEAAVKPGVNRKVGVLRIEEGEIRDGKFVRARVLNGDEQMSVRFGEKLKTLRVQWYTY